MNTGGGCGMNDERPLPGEYLGRGIETYLGDDLYASLDGDNVILRASDKGHRIVLEPEALGALARFVATLPLWRILVGVNR
jgi:hypothetical protein